MSFFDHLVERALGQARVVEPIVGPSPLGPAPLEATTREPWTPQIDEVAATPPALPAPTRSLAPTPSPSPTLATKPTTAPSRELVRTRELVTQVQSPAPLVGPGTVATPRGAPTRASEAAGKTGKPSPTIERRVEVHTDHTHTRERVATRVERHTNTTRERIETRTTTQVEPAARALAPRSSEAAPRQRPRELAGPASPSRPTAEPIRPPPAPALQAHVAPRSERPAGLDAPLARRVPAADPAPTLRIEIGRVVVRADVGPAPQRSAPASTRPLTSLSEYLRERERGES